jgi:HAD superfamily hydrolase (TIGR01549 family)
MHDMNSAVIFDVDGVLLELTRDEEEIFFSAFQHLLPTEKLSRDWNSYRIRNDEDIIAEILERNGLPPDMRQQVIDRYLALLGAALAGDLRSVCIPGAANLIQQLSGKAQVGIATANLLAAARLRLQQASLWNRLSLHAQGADGGGHKHEILARLLARMAVSPSRVVYVGDNLNDVEAGLRNGVHFIGFSQSAARRSQLQAHGARHVSSNHTDTLHLIHTLLA